MMADNPLYTGIQLAKGGEYEKAIPFLAEAVRRNPSAEQGWLWLGHCLAEPAQRKYCYRRVLALDPKNVDARQSLDQLLSFEPDSGVPASEPSPSVPARSIASIPPPDQAAPQPVPAKKGRRPAPAKRARTGAALFRVFLAFLLLAALGALYVWVMGPQKLIQASPLATYFPLSPTSTDTPTETPIPPTITATAEQPAGFFLRQAQDQIVDENWSEALASLDRAILIDPARDEAYDLRAECYLSLAPQQASIPEYLNYLNRALADSDRAIAIRPGRADYYLRRQSVLTLISDAQTYRVDRLYVESLAAENSAMALTLGASPGSGADRILAIHLIYSGQCQPALDRLDEMIARSADDKAGLGALYMIQSQAYACVDDAALAVDAIDRSIASGGDSDYKGYLRSIYLYQAGRSQEALKLLDRLIPARPHYVSTLYFLRALIEYELDSAVQADRDLALGKEATTNRAGLYAYVLGKVYIESGDTDAGIALLQDAEASLDHLFNPLRRRIAAELSALGAKLLEEPLTVVLPSTPLPTVPATATVRPTQTATVTLTPTPTRAALRTATPAPTFTSAPLVTYPYNLAQAAIIDLDSGSGRVTLAPGEERFFHVQPSQAVAYRSVTSLSVRLTAAPAQAVTPGLELRVWAPLGGRWDLKTPAWGDNLLDDPGAYVAPEGDIFLTLYNPGELTVLVDNLAVVLTVELQDGTIWVFGQ
jgi:tetratricopeptide (TPR) repeat protein